MLTVVSGSSTNEGVTDPGVYLPDITGVTASWFEEVSIFVEWEHSTDAKVKGYHIYIAEDMFASTDEATMVGETVSANTFVIDASGFADLNNQSAWYIGVVPVSYTHLRAHET